MLCSGLGFFSHANSSEKSEGLRVGGLQRKLEYYFFGACWTGAALVPFNTEPALPVWRAAITLRMIEVSMKMIADHVVARESAFAVPRGPNAVWLPLPPNAAASRHSCRSVAVQLRSGRNKQEREAP